MIVWDVLVPTKGCVRRMGVDDTLTGLRAGEPPRGGYVQGCKVHGMVDETGKGKGHATGLFYSRYEMKTRMGIELRARRGFT